MADPSSAPGDPAIAPAAVVTPFPPPPPYFTLYARGAAAGPPPPPAPAAAPDGPLLIVFGAEHRASEDPPAPLQVPDLLRRAGVDPLGDPRPGLHLLLDAVLAGALALLDTLVDSPADYAAGATAAIGALHNLMHAFNGLRPAQTRFALARALEGQVRHKREAARAVREAARAAGEELARRAGEVERAAAAAAAMVAADGADGADGVAGDGDGDAMEVEGAVEGTVAKRAAGAKAAVGRSGGIPAPATGW